MSFRGLSPLKLPAENGIPNKSLPMSLTKYQFGKHFDKLFQTNTACIYQQENSDLGDLYILHHKERFHIAI